MQPNEALVRDGYEAMARGDDRALACRTVRSGDEPCPVTPEVMTKAIELQHELARRGQHRVRIPDLIISAAAVLAELIVLLYDSDFERAAAAGGAPRVGRHPGLDLTTSLPSAAWCTGTAQAEFGCCGFVAAEHAAERTRA